MDAKQDELEVQHLRLEKAEGMRKNLEHLENGQDRVLKYPFVCLVTGDQLKDPDKGVSRWIKDRDSITPLYAPGYSIIP